MNFLDEEKERFHLRTVQQNATMISLDDLSERFLDFPFVSNRSEPLIYRSCETL